MGQGWRVRGRRGVGGGSSVLPSRGPKRPLQLGGWEGPGAESQEGLQEGPLKWTQNKQGAWRGPASNFLPVLWRFPP